MIMRHMNQRNPMLDTIKKGVGHVTGAVGTSSSSVGPVTGCLWTCKRIKQEKRRQIIQMVGNQEKIYLLRSNIFFLKCSYSVLLLCPWSMPKGITSILHEFPNSGCNSLLVLTYLHMAKFHILITSMNNAWTSLKFHIVLCIFKGNYLNWSCLKSCNVV